MEGGKQRGRLRSLKFLVVCSGYLPWKDLLFSLPLPCFAFFQRAVCPSRHPESQSVTPRKPPPPISCLPCLSHPVVRPEAKLHDSCSTARPPLVRDHDRLRGRESAQPCRLGPLALRVGLAGGLPTRLYMGRILRVGEVYTAKA